MCGAFVVVVRTSRREAYAMPRARVKDARHDDVPRRRAPLRPDYDPGRPLEEQSGWDAHAAFMDGLVDAGFLVLGGPLEDEERVVHAVFADSEEMVRETLARDPWSGTHLVVEVVEAWTIRLDGTRR
jgi:hypothetical protein